MAGEPKIGSDVRGALILAAVLVTLAELLEVEAIGYLVAIIVFFLVVFMMTKVPIRHSMMGLMFLALTLPNFGEGFPTSEWLPPYAYTGAILLNHINTVNHNLPMPFSGMDVMFVTLGLIALSRKGSGSKIDSYGTLPTPAPLIRYAKLSLATTAFVWVSGMLRGGDVNRSLWQVCTVVYLPIIFLLFQTSFRGPKDLWPLAKVVLVAACYKAALAIYVIHTVFTKDINPDTGTHTLAFATSHQDSVLFADAFVLVLALLIERVDRRALRLALFVLPLLALGMSANHRRTVWVQVALALLVVYVISRETRLKRVLRRGVYFLIPTLIVYAIAGWNSGSGRLFKPIRMMRSIVDAQSDASSMWREIENFDLIVTFRGNPLFGKGYGNQYDNPVILPPVDYDLERWVPHNGLLGLWSFAGILGYAGLTMLWAGGVYFAMRTYYSSKEPAHRAASIVCFGSVFVYMMQAWADLGLGPWAGVYTVAASICVAGKLAVANGQWGTPAKKPKPAPPTAGVSASPGTELV